MNKSFLYKNISLDESNSIVGWAERQPEVIEYDWCLDDDDIRVEMGMSPENWDKYEAELCKSEILDTKIGVRRQRQ